MKIVVCKPKHKYTISHNSHYLYNDLLSFYTLLEEILKELNIPYTIIVRGFRDYQIENKSVSLGHHIYNTPKNVWSIKRGYIPGYLYFDKNGYSGWSEGLSRYNSNAPYTNKQIYNALKIGKFYITNNISKGIQPKNCKIPNKPYVLVLKQKLGDTVSKLAYIRTNLLPELVKKAYENTEINVYVKEHPAVCKETIKNDSLHTLIEHANAVYTVNSGSGFEALFHGKKVYTSGACDYSAVTTEVKSYEDIYNTRFEKAPSLNEIGHFLHYCFNEHFVNAFDKESIKRKVLRAMDEYVI